MRPIFLTLLLPLWSLAADDYNADSTVPHGAQTAGANGGPAKTAGLRQVVIAYKTHFDIGYTARTSEVVQEYRTEMADRLLEAIERNSREPKEKQFVWTVSGWPMKQILWDGQSAERRAAIEKAIREGNLAIHAYPFTTHTEIAELEDLVRGLNISSTLCRQYGRPLSTAAKMTDVPGQSWVLPTLLSKAGVRFYHMGGPCVNKDLGLPPVFWWEGPDGSRVLTLYNNGYGTTAMPPEGWPFRTWLYLSMTGDNQGPPPPDIVARDLEFYRTKGIEAKVGRLDDFAELLLKEDLSKLPVVRGDIPDPWIHGTMSMPEAARTARRARLEIGGLEALTTLERCWGIARPDNRSVIAQAYEQSALYAEHTWGLANQHYIKTPYGPAWDRLWSEGLPPQYRKMEESWQDHADYARNVERLTHMPFQEAVTTLADQVAVEGPRVVVYNPLPWERDGEVCVNAFHFPNGNALQPVDGGPAVPYATEGPTVEDPHPRIRRFVARAVPPLGYRTYRVVTAKLPEAGLSAEAATGVLESPHFRARLDPKAGRITSLIDKHSGRELVAEQAPQGFGQYLYERFSWQQIEDWLNASLYPQYRAHRICFAAYDMPRDVPYAAALPAAMTLSMTSTPIDVSAVMTGTLPGPGRPQQVSIRLTLNSAMPVADLTVEWDKQPDSWPEAGWICLPFKIEHPKFRLGKLGGDLDPVADLTVANANYYNSWVNTGACVYDGRTGAGVGLCPLDSPMVSLGTTGEYKFQERYEPTTPSVFVNLYNNHWRTNFAAWVGDGRRMTSRVRLWAFDQFKSGPALLAPAMEARVPLQVGRSVCHPGKLPPTRAGLRLSRNGVLVTAFGENPDGEGVILRVWEQSGESGPLVVELPEGSEFKTATPVSLRGGKTGEPLPIEGRKITFDLGKYAPASFRLQ